MALFGKKPRFLWPPAWTYTGDGLLWLLRFSPAGRIVGEVRHPAEKTVRYFCLDERSGAPLWENRGFDEPWWIGVEDVTADRLFLHRFRKPDMPQHLGILALDIETGALLWENPDFTFLFVRNDTIYAARQGFEAMKYYALDAVDGSVQRELGTDTAQINALRTEINAIDWFAGYAYPESLPNSHPAHGEADRLLRAQVRQEALRGPVDVLLTPELLAASWHETLAAAGGGSATLSQRFAAWRRRDGALAFETELGRGMSAPGPDSFFTKDGQLFYIRDGITLTAHTLPGTLA